MKPLKGGEKEWEMLGRAGWSKQIWRDRPGSDLRRTEKQASRGASSCSSSGIGVGGWESNCLKRDLIAYRKIDHERMESRFRRRRLKSPFGPLVWLLWSLPSLLAFYEVGVRKAAWCPIRAGEYRDSAVATSSAFCFREENVVSTTPMLDLLSIYPVALSLLGVSFSVSGNGNYLSKRRKARLTTKGRAKVTSHQVNSDSIKREAFALREKEVRPEVSWLLGQNQSRGSEVERETRKERNRGETRKENAARKSPIHRGSTFPNQSIHVKVRVTERWSEGNSNRKAQAGLAVHLRRSRIRWSWFRRSVQRSRSVSVLIKEFCAEVNESRERFDCRQKGWSGFDVLWFRISPGKHKNSFFSTASIALQQDVRVSMQCTHLWNRRGRTEGSGNIPFQVQTVGSSFDMQAMDYPIAVSRAGQAFSSSLERRSISQPEICCFSGCLPKDGNCT